MAENSLQLQQPNHYHENILYDLLSLLTAATCRPRLLLPPIPSTRKKGTGNNNLKKLKAARKNYFPTSSGNEPANAALLDSTIFNKYGDLLNEIRNTTNVSHSGNRLLK